MTAPALHWISEIDQALLALDEKPQFGPSKAFSWESLESELQGNFHKSDLTISHKVKGWMTPDQLWPELGSKQLPLAIEWAPLQALSYFTTDEQSLKELMGELFDSKEVASYFYDASLANSFYQYFSLELLHALEKQKFAAPATARIGEPPEDLKGVLGAHAYFVIDVGLTISGRTFWGRILLSERFRKEWKSYFSQQMENKLSEEMRQKIMVELGLGVGYTRLSLSEWKSVKKGDFVLLDHCSYDPDAHSGGVVLTLNQKPIFRGRFKDEGIKITNYPVYEEVTKDMEEEYDEDDDLYGLNESEFEEEEELFKDLDEQEETKEEEEEVLEESSFRPEVKPSEEKAIKPEEIPLHITVEVGRIRMTAQELIGLAPGNLLELNVSPEQGVDLVVNGKKIGRGELMRIGDVLGVRILSL